MINIQAMIYAGMVIGVGSLYFFYHHLPIQQLRSDVDELQMLVKNKNTTISNLNHLLLKCKEQQKVIDFEKYFDGLSEAEDENNTTHPKYSF